jgi:peptide/nickel transport system permease protein
LTDTALVLTETRAPTRRLRWLRRFSRSSSGVVGLVLTLAVLVVAVFAESIAPHDPFRAVGSPFQPPSGRHWMGTDDLGRDLFSAVVAGARTSMTVVVAVSAISAVIGLVVGAVAGYRGGLVDDGLMRVTEMFQSVPRFFLALLVVALFGAGLSNLILLLGVTSWPLLARVVRTETLSLREREFVGAARALGASNARIVIGHILPHVVPAALVIIALMGSRVILLEASLSFLGLGDPNAMSWGLLANNAQRFMRVAWWMTVFPGLAILVAVLGLNLLSDAINSALDPHVRSRPGERPRTV